MASWKKLTNLVLVLISDMIKINQKFILVSILMAMGIAETYHPAPPDIPEIQGMYNHEKISITWNKKAEGSIDPLTGYSDFEGYRIYGARKTLSEVDKEFTLLGEFDLAHTDYMDIGYNTGFDFIRIVNEFSNCRKPG